MISGGLQLSLTAMLRICRILVHCLSSALRIHYVHTGVTSFAVHHMCKGSLHNNMYRLHPFRAAAVPVKPKCKLRGMQAIILHPSLSCAICLLSL